MGDDIVEHLSSAHVFGHHVVVVLVDDHLTHTADVRVVKQLRKRGLSNRPGLLGSVLGGLLGCSLCVGSIGVRSGGVYAWQDLDGELGTGETRLSTTRHEPAKRERDEPFRQ